MARIHLGLTRPLDEQGRVFVCVELRQTLGIAGHVLIEADPGVIVIRRAGCVFCGRLAAQPLGPHGATVCGSCCQEAAELAKRSGR